METLQLVNPFTKKEDSYYLVDMNLFTNAQWSLRKRCPSHKFDELEHAEKIGASKEFIDISRSKLMTGALTIYGVDGDDLNIHCQYAPSKNHTLFTISDTMAECGFMNGTIITLLPAILTLNELMNIYTNVKQFNECVKLTLDIDLSGQRMLC